MARNLLGAMLSLSFILGFPTDEGQALASRPRSVQFVIGQSVYVVDSVVQIMDATPFIRDGRTMVPVRYLAMALGIPESGIGWDAATGTVSLGWENVRLEMVIGQKVLLTSGKPVQLDVAPVIEGGRTYLPARYVAEALGYQVGWNQATQAVVIAEEAARQSTEDLKDLVVKVQGNIVLVMVYDGAGQQLGLGSGVAVGTDLVVTNLHVVQIQGAMRATVSLPAGTEYPVEGIVAQDAFNDLALIKVGARLAPAVLGDSDQLALGAKVLAIGNPLGLQNTVSEGIVSGLRELGNRKLIQTTAPISPGSSGGGLFDLNGRLVGITVAHIEGGQNLNLAVPVNLVKALLAGTGATVPLSAVNPAPPQLASSGEVAALLNRELSLWDSSTGKLRFEFRDATTFGLGEQRIEVFGLIDPATYMAWLLVSPAERDSVIKQLAGAIDRFSGGAAFLITLFYQDYWSFYPTSFRPDEVTLSADGLWWLVTHVIGQAFTSGDHIRFQAYP